jgi:hypothetical protein
LRAKPAGFFGHNFGIAFTFNGVNHNFRPGTRQCERYSATDIGASPRYEGVPSGEGIHHVIISRAQFLMDHGTGHSR